MTRPNKTRRFAPSLLTLEDRTVPAGNVTATLIDYYGTPTLQVFGDAADNSIILRGNGPGVVEVQGIGTTVNGGNKKLTFSGVRSLRVDGGDGNDTIRSQALAIGDISVSGGSGDDVIDLANTTGGVAFGTATGLYLGVAGDSGGPNGNDTISVTGTTVQGDFAQFYIQGDDFYDTVGGLDRITLANTKIDVSYADIGIAPYGEYGLSEPGNIITVDNFDLTVDQSPYSLSYVTFQGGSGDDQFHLHNINVNMHSETDVEGWVFVGSYEGNDTIDASNVHLSATTDRTVGHDFELFNQFFVSFWADTVRIDNLDFVGGGTFYVPDTGGHYTTGGSVGITGSDVEVRNTHVHTNGFGGLWVNADDELYFGEPVRDRTWTLANVQVTSASGDLGDLSLDSGSGNDGITITNASCDGLFSVSLGEGDDTLRMTNVAGDVYVHAVFGTFGGIFGGGGNDTVSMVNCTFLDQFIDLGEGNDDLTLVNNTFGTLAVGLGDGDDTATVYNNTATVSLAIDGGDGTDTLIAWLNLAPLVDFDNFEL